MTTKQRGPSVFSILRGAAGKIVSVITDGSEERLAVDAKLATSDLTFQLAANTPQLDFDSAGLAITTAWSTLVEVTGTAGKLDMIACVLGSSNYRVRLTVDSTEIFDLSMSDLNAIGLTNAVNVEIWAETALKNFRYRPNVPVDFTDNMKIEVAMTTGTGTLYYLINYRIQT